MSNSSTSTQSPPPTAEDVILLTGPLFYGSIFNWGLLGVMLIQIYYFSVNFPRERIWMKILVYTLLVLDLLQTAFTTNYVHGVLVAGWGNPAPLVEFSWSGTTIPIMTGLESLIVQVFFAWRIWILSPRNILKFIPVLIVLVALMQSLSAIVNGIRFALVQDAAKIPTLTLGVEIWLAGSFTADILIAGSMLAILIPIRRNSPWKKTESVITKLIIHTVETGVVTMVTAGVELALFLRYKDNLLHEVPAFILGKMYTNVMLANDLNARNRGQGTSTVGGSESFSLPFRSGGTGSRPKQFVQVDTTITRDEESSVSTGG